MSNFKPFAKAFNAWTFNAWTDEARAAAAAARKHFSGAEVTSEEGVHTISHSSIPPNANGAREIHMSTAESNWKPFAPAFNERLCWGKPCEAAAESTFKAEQASRIAGESGRSKDHEAAMRAHEGAAEDNRKAKESAKSGGNDRLMHEHSALEDRHTAKAAFHEREMKRLRAGGIPLGRSR